MLEKNRCDLVFPVLWKALESKTEGTRLYLVDQCTWRQLKKDGGHIDGSVDLVGAVEVVGQNNTKVSLPCFFIEAKVSLVDAHPQLCGEASLPFNTQVDVAIRFWE